VEAASKSSEDEAAAECDDGDGMGSMFGSDGSEDVRTLQPGQPDVFNAEGSAMQPGDAVAEAATAAAAEAESATKAQAELTVTALEVEAEASLEALLEANPGMGEQGVAAAKAEADLALEAAANAEVAAKAEAAAKAELALSDPFKVAQLHLLDPTARVLLSQQTTSGNDGAGSSRSHLAFNIQGHIDISKTSIMNVQVIFGDQVYNLNFQWGQQYVTHAKLTV
jgi:hypothetical protein